VWVALKSVPDWRWLLGREDSPWYPGAKLYRQNAIGDWDGVLSRVGADLAGWMQAGAVPAERVVGTAGLAVPRATPGGASEVARRKASIAAGSTDVERWANPEQLEAAWERRSVQASNWIPAGATVLDVGCGAMRLERHLPVGCEYLPCDVVRRDRRTTVVDLNDAPLPQAVLARADVVALLGVWEYLYDPARLMAQLRAAGKTVVCSYCTTEGSAHLDRRGLGWVNDFSLEGFVRLAEEAGYAVRACSQIDALQYLFKFTARNDLVFGALPRVHVIGYQNVGNFGDRLGYHLIHDVLPARCEVSWGTLQPFTPVPEGVDLLVVGIGNSLFGGLLSDQLIGAVRSAKRSVGIFGTQYRELLPTAQLHALLDALTWWHARYEEDVLLYGKGRTNVSHLGDWLINAFPMARGDDDKVLHIDEEVWDELPLDRTIQRIQARRKVISTRLHPLLCALTSAQVVGYIEQREGPDRRTVSGKFRSLLMDVFGESYPEYEAWEVDRDKVASYKRRVRANTDALRAQIAQWLQG